jgi:hypothetical protein
MSTKHGMGGYPSGWPPVFMRGNKLSADTSRGRIRGYVMVYMCCTWSTGFCPQWLLAEAVGGWILDVWDQQGRIMSRISYGPKWE